MTQFFYRPEAWATLENSLDDIFEPTFKDRGLRLHQVHCYEGKGMIIYEAPDDNTALEAISTSTLLKLVEVSETTPLSIIGEIAKRTNFLSSSARS
jgi:hypothetical protein